MSVQRYREVKKAIEDNVVETMGVELSISRLETRLEELSWEVEETQRETNKCEDEICDEERAKDDLEYERQELEAELVALECSGEWNMDSTDENQVGLW